MNYSDIFYKLLHLLVPACGSLTETAQCFLFVSNIALPYTIARELHQIPPSKCIIQMCRLFFIYLYILEKGSCQLVS